MIRLNLPNLHEHFVEENVEAAVDHDEVVQDWSAWFGSIEQGTPSSFDLLRERARDKRLARFDNLDLDFDDRCHQKRRQKRNGEEP